MRYWACECCSSLLVTYERDDATEYQCPQCNIVECDHGGQYIEISERSFDKETKRSISELPKTFNQHFKELGEAIKDLLMVILGIFGIVKRQKRYKDDR